jgi:hypothetical protein
LFLLQQQKVEVIIVLGKVEISILNFLKMDQNIINKIQGLKRNKILAASIKLRLG